MVDARTSDPPAPEPEDEARPKGIPAAASTRRALRPPRNARVPGEVADHITVTTDQARPAGLPALTASARQRLELALDADGSEPPPPPDESRPVGLGVMTPSARQRLQLALDEDDDGSIPPPTIVPASALPTTDVVPAPAASSASVPLDARGRRLLRGLAGTVGLTGLLTLTVGALTGLSYLTGPGSVAHVVVGILASALSVWLLAAGISFHRAVSTGVPHHLATALSSLRTAFMLKAILLFSAMVLGCFTFSIATGLLLLL